MQGIKFFTLAAVAGLCFASSAPKAQSQVSVEIGAAPACPYGYFETAPYGCAPYGYYGPEWFSGGVFIGAGPWFHGPEHFQGPFQNPLPPRQGFQGAIPPPGEPPEPEHSHPPGNFPGNEGHDGH